MKYIINTDDLYRGDIYKSMLLMGTNSRGEVIVQKFNLDELEELTADYINEHFGDLQDEAYQKGLNDAWEAAKKISLMTSDEIEKVFPGAAKYNRYNLGYSGVEAIDKLKAYEEKQKAGDEIKVRDEVMVYGSRGVVTYVHDNLYTVMMYNGSCGNWGRNELEKTGKQHDIDKILEAMKE